MADEDGARQCRNCTSSARADFDEMRAHMEDFVATIRPEHRADDETYRGRLTACMACTGLYYETTCRYCGCIVEMRALRKGKDCPFPAGSRW